MNIFFLDRDPLKCAQYHCDRHSVAMVKEYAQILSTAHRLHNASDFNLKRKNYTIYSDEDLDSKLLKATHVGNRTVAWVMESRENYSWLAKVLTYLSIEYTSRYGREHKYSTIGLIKLLWYNPPIILIQNSAPIDYFYKKLSIENFDSLVSEESYVSGDPILSYRNCYMKEKKYMVDYRLGNWPIWFN